MKQFFPFKTFLLLALALSLLSFSHHTNDEDAAASLCKRIEGKWRVTSYVEDGEERLGEDFKKVTMEYNGSDCEGAFVFTILYTDDDEEDEVRGDYLVYEEIGKIRLEPDGDDGRTFSLKIEGNEFEMSGNVDGSRSVTKARRR